MSIIKCSQCKKLVDRKDVSYPQREGGEKMPVCVDCLEQILLGNIEPKEI